MDLYHHYIDICTVSGRYLWLALRGDVAGGAGVDQMDVSGNTPLHLAARAGNTKTASTLLNLGASVNMKVSFCFP